MRLRTAESAALAAGDTQAVAESLLEHALAPLGATAVAVWSAGSDASLTLCGHAGFSADEAGRWRYVPPGVATVARQALSERRTVRLSSLAEAGVPSIVHTRAPSGGRVALPAGTGGRIRDSSTPFTGWRSHESLTQLSSSDTDDDTCLIGIEVA